MIPRALANMENAHTVRRVQHGETHKVGAIYFNGYWQYLYRVESVDGYTVTATAIEDGGHNIVVPGETWTHSTALDPRSDWRVIA